MWKQVTTSSRHGYSNTPSGTDVDLEQQQEVAGGETEDSQDWPDIEETTQGFAGSSKSKGETGTNPSRLKEEHRHLPKKSHQYQRPVTRNQAPARTSPRTPLRPQLRILPRTPPRAQLRIPPRTPPKNLRKIHQHLQNMLKHTDRQASYG